MFRVNPKTLCILVPQNNLSLHMGISEILLTDVILSPIKYCFVPKIAERACKSFAAISAISFSV